MGSKKWVEIWFASVMGVMILVFGFNYIVDPYGANRTFKYDFNRIKKQLDTRSEKIELLKNAQYNTFIFGSSRATIIDPELIDKNLTNSRAFNFAFGSALMFEIETYFNFIISNQTNIKNIFIGIDLFAFSEFYSARRVNPTEDLVRSITNRFNVKTFFQPEYLSYKTFIDSVSVIKANKFGVVKCNKKCASYKKKGMRYYKDFLDLKEYDIKKYVTDIRPYWKVDSFSFDRVEMLKRILKESVKNNITAFVYTNPLTIGQIFAGGNRKNNFPFLVQLDLIEEIVRGTGIGVYDFNNLNSVNFDDNYFINRDHFNYKVADCIINKMTLGASSCGNNFGEFVDERNIIKYKETIKEKFAKLKADYERPSLPSEN
jgi:hypothetical protein